MNGSPWQDRRVWLGGGAVVAVLLIAASWMLLIGPALDSAADLRSQEADAQTQNTLTLTKNSKLAEQDRQIAGKKAELLTALAGLPTTTALPAFTLQVTALAKLDHVSLSSVGFSQPTAAGAATSGGTQEPSSTTSNNSTAPSTASGPSPAATPPATATTVAVTLTTAGSVDAQTRFLSDLRTGLRRTLNTSTQLATSGPDSTTMTTQLTIFSAAMTKAQLDQINRDLRSN